MGSSRGVVIFIITNIIRQMLLLAFAGSHLWHLQCPKPAPSFLSYPQPPSCTIPLSEAPNPCLVVSLPAPTSLNPQGQSVL